MDVHVDLTGYDVPKDWSVVLGNGYIVHGDFPGDQTYKVMTPLGWLVKGEFISVDKCPPEYRTKKEEPAQKPVREYKADDFKPENLGAELLYLINSKYQNVTSRNLPAKAYKGSLEGIKELLAKAENFHYNQGVEEGLVTIADLVLSIKDAYLKYKN